MKVTKQVTLTIDVTLDIDKMCREYETKPQTLLNELDERIKLYLVRLIEEETKSNYSQSTVTEVSIEEV